ncbi:MAG: hypothetical protein ACK53Y_01645, partial [bacterium]
KKNNNQTKQQTHTQLKLTVQSFKFKEYENEERLVFSSMKIGKDYIRLKWKKWEMKQFYVQ